MGCLFVMFSGLFPRLGTLLIWLARPAYFNIVWGGSWLWPVLGILFLPFTSLMYVLMWPPAGPSGWDWLWLALAVLIDLSGYASSAYANRERLPGYSGT